jgi:hypothetical protein
MASSLDGSAAERFVYFQAKVKEGTDSASALTAVLQPSARRPAKPFRLSILPLLIGNQRTNPVLFRLTLTPEELVSNEVSLVLSNERGVIAKKTVKVDWNVTRNLFIFEVRAEEADKRDYCVQNTAEELGNYLAFVAAEGWQEGLVEAAVPLWANLKAPVGALAMLQGLNRVLGPAFTTMPPPAQVFTAAIYGVLGSDLAIWPGPPGSIITASNAYKQHLNRPPDLPEYEKLPDNPLTDLINSYKS